MAKVRVSFKTLGCKLNFSETSAIANKLSGKGYEVVNRAEESDIFVVNTCSVTAQAEKKCRQAITAFHHKNPKGKIAVIGCYAQLDAEKLSKIPGVNLVLGAKEKSKLDDYLEHINEFDNEIHSCGIDAVEKFHTAHSEGDRTRSFLKVQDGCDYHCTYCTIPLARGKSRNPAIKELIEESKGIGDKGIQEIILTGVNVGDFGKSTGERFIDLLAALDKESSVPRIRLSSVEPNLLNNDIIDLVKNSERILPHFHIPLQSGCDTILAAMKRRYNTSLFANRVEYIRQQIPDAFIGVDVIVGFPGESEKLFEETHQFLQNLEASFYHVFSYSIRPHTPAAEMNHKIEPGIIKERSKLIQKLAHYKQFEFYENHLGQTRPVLFEAKNQKGMLLGYTDNYIKVQVPWQKELNGAIKNAVLEDIDKNNLVNIKLL